MPSVAKNKNRNAFRGRTNHTDRDCNFTERDTGTGCEFTHHTQQSTHHCRCVPVTCVRPHVLAKDGGTRVCSSASTCVRHMFWPIKTEMEKNPERLQISLFQKKIWSGERTPQYDDETRSTLTSISMSNPVLSTESASAHVYNQVHQKQIVCE